MNLVGWLNGVVVIAVTLIPIFLSWASAVLWWRSRSPWALLALAGAASVTAGVVLVWIGFYIHYSSVEVMRAQNEHPNEMLHLAFELIISIGFFIAAFGLVGYARSLPKQRATAIVAEG